MSEPRTKSWIPTIPAPLQRLFDHFPLVTYPANELPARAPRPSSLPTLYVFASDDDAAAGSPSFNPSCLKWQTLLHLSNTPFALLPSTNHASPTGSLPYLQPPTPSASTLPPRPIPSSNIERYIALHSPPDQQPTTTPTSSLPAPTLLAQEPYLSLLTTSIRCAWLTALYLDPLNTPLLTALYITPTSTSPLIRTTLLSQLRTAAEAEVLRIVSPTTGAGGWKITLNAALEFGPGAKATAVVDHGEIYREAERAFGSLAGLLGESATGWFFGVERPGVFDAAVFAYTHLVQARIGGEGQGLEWRDGGRLDGIVRAAGRGELVGHRERVWELCWGGEKREV